MIVAATGHRPNRLGGYRADVARRLETLAFDWLQFVGATEAISGLALGWDWAVVRAAHRLGLTVTGAMPFVGQERKWPEASQRAYVEILGLCDRVEVISAGGYSTAAMHERDEWMVDHGEIVCALWDGSPSGTGSTLSYAQRRDVPIVNLWPLWRG